jgi:hypothetical protein
MEPKVTKSAERMAALEARAAASEAKIASLFAVIRAACEAAGTPVPEEALEVTGRLDAIEHSLVLAFRAAHWPVPEGMQDRPPQPHLSLVKP